MANKDDEQGHEHDETEDEASSDEGREENERDEEEGEEDERDDESDDSDSDSDDSDDAAEAPPAASASNEAEDDGDEDDAPAPAPAAAAPATKSKPKKMTAGARVAAAKAAKAAQKAVKKAAYAEERAAQTNAPAPTPEEEEADPVEQIKETPLGQATVRAQEWVGDNQGLVIGALAVAAIALLGYFGYQYVNDNAAVAAGALLEEAVEISRAEIRDEGEEADEDDDERSYASVAERTEAALAAYRRVTSEASGSAAAGWARLGEARLLLDSGEATEAREAFEAAIASHGADPVIAMRAYEGVGFTYEAEENWDEARESFERIRSLSNGEYAAVADYNLARVRLATGDDVGAQTALEELVDELREESASGEPAFPYVLAQAQTLLRELDPSSASAAAPTLGAGASEEEIMEMIRRAMESRGASGE